MFNAAIILILLASLVIFILYAARPLNPKQAIQLAGKRRIKSINKYYYFQNVDVSIDAAFKKAMNPKGAFYDINEHMRIIPTLIASLLKYKKHEWIVIAFERQQQVDLIWTNKGADRSSVSSLLYNEDILNKALSRKYSSIFIFHNHPNTNPQHYDCSNPSQADLDSANVLASLITPQNVNLLEFVCERGSSKIYHKSISESFLPVDDFLKSIQRLNGTSRFNNISMNFERIFS